MRPQTWHLSLLIILSNTSCVWADSCDTILDEKLKTEITDQRSDDVRQAVLQEACSLSFKEFKDKHGGNAEGTYKWISFGANYDDEGYKKFIEKACSRNQSQYSHNSNTYYKLSALNDNAITAWSDCMKGSFGFFCYAKKLSPSVATLKLSWNPTSDEKFSVDKNSIYLKNFDLHPTPPKDIDHVGVAVYTLTRENTHELATLTFNGTGKTRTFPCEAYILPEIGRKVKISDSNSELLYIKDQTCFLDGKAPCNFLVGWSNPKPGKQFIIRAGNNNEGYFACGNSDGKLKLATWGPSKIALFEVPDISINTGDPNTSIDHGCSLKLPPGVPSATSSIEFVE